MYSSFNLLLMLEKYLFSSFIIPEGVYMWESLVFIDCGKMLSRVGSVRFLTCFHELVIFLQLISKINLFWPYELV